MRRFGQRPRSGWRLLCGVLAVAIAVTSLPPASALASPSDIAPHDLTRVDLRSFGVPQSLGDVIETWQPSGRPPDGVVIHIQDLHVHPEAQRRTAQLLDELHRRWNLSLVGVEGASAPVDTSFYSKFPEPKLVERVSQAFVAQGVFTGAEQYAITHPGAVRLQGIEDEAVYQEHLAIWRQGSAAHDQAIAILRRLRGALDPLAQRLYPRRVRTLLHLRDASDKQPASQDAFQRFASVLISQAESLRINLKSYPEVRAYRRAWRLYHRIDMRAVERDRSTLFAALAPRVDLSVRHELDGLARRVAAAGLPPEIYDAVLLKAGEQAGVVPPHLTAGRQYRALRLFVAYQQLSKRIQTEQLAEQLDAVSEAVEQASLKTEQQRLVAKLLRDTDLLDGLLTTKLSPAQVRLYQAHRHELTADALWPALQSLLLHLAPLTRGDLDTLLSALPAHEQFYDLALRRDDALAANLLRQMQQHDASQAIVIAGGFHTPGLTERLKAHNIAYAVIAPRVTTEFPEQLYHDRLDGKLPDAATILRDVRAAQALAVASALKNPKVMALFAAAFAAAYLASGHDPSQAADLIKTATDGSAVLNPADLTLSGLGETVSLAEASAMPQPPVPTGSPSILRTIAGASADVFLAAVFFGMVGGVGGSESDDEKKLAALIHDLKSPEREIRIAAIQAIGAMGPRGAPAVPALVNYFEATIVRKESVEPEVEVEWDAIVGAMDIIGLPAMRVLFTALADSNYQHTTPEEGLLRSVFTTPAHHRATAATLILDGCSNQHILEFLQQLPSPSTSEDDRKLAMVSIQFLRRKLGSVLALKRLKNDGKVDVAMQSAEILAGQDSTLLESLTTWLQNTNPQTELEKPLFQRLIEKRIFDKPGSAIDLESVLLKHTLAGQPDAIVLLQQLGWGPAGLSESPSPSTTPKPRGRGRGGIGGGRASLWPFLLLLIGLLMLASPAFAAGLEARGLGQQRQEVARAQDAHALEGVERQQIMVAGDQESGMTDRGFQEHVVLGVAAGGHAVDGANQPAVPLNQRQQLLDIGRGREDAQRRAGQHLNQLSQGLLGEDQRDVTMQKRVIDAARSGSGEQGGHEDVRVNDGEYAQNVPAEPSRTAGESREPTTSDGQRAAGVSSPVAPSGPVESGVPNGGPDAALPAPAADPQAVPPVSQRLQSTVSASKSPERQHTPAVTARQASLRLGQSRSLLRLFLWVGVLAVMSVLAGPALAAGWEALPHALDALPQIADGVAALDPASLETKAASMSLLVISGLLLSLLAVVFWTLGEGIGSGSDDQRRLDSLIRDMKSPVWERREAALQAMAAIGPSALPVLPALRDRYIHLGRSEESKGSFEANIVAALREMLDDHFDEKRLIENAVKSMGTPALQGLLISSAEQSSSEDRFEIEWLIRNCFSSTQVLDVLRGLPVGSDGREDQLLVSGALRWLGGNALPSLRALRLELSDLEEGDPNFRSDLQGYFQATPVTDEMVELVTAWLNTLDAQESNRIFKRLVDQVFSRTGSADDLESILLRHALTGQPEAIALLQQLGWAPPGLSETPPPSTTPKPRGRGPGFGGGRIFLWPLLILLSGALLTMASPALAAGWEALPQPRAALVQGASQERVEALGGQTTQELGGTTNQQQHEPTSGDAAQRGLSGGAEHASADSGQLPGGSTQSQRPGTSQWRQSSHPSPASRADVAKNNPAQNPATKLATSTPRQTSDSLKKTSPPTIPASSTIVAFWKNLASHLRRLSVKNLMAAIAHSVRHVYDAVNAPSVLTPRRPLFQLWLILSVIALLVLAGPALAAGWEALPQVAEVAQQTARPSMDAGWQWGMALGGPWLWQAWARLRSHFGRSGAASPAVSGASAPTAMLDLSELTLSDSSRQAASAIRPTLKPGDVVGGWTLGQPVGGGGFSTVFAVQTNDQLVIKVQALPASPQAQAAFSRQQVEQERTFYTEIVPTDQQLAARVPRRVDASIDEEHGVGYLVMERAPGMTLQELVQKRGTLAARPHEAIQMAQDLLGTLALIHAHGRVWGDLQPNNVLGLDPERPAQRLMAADFSNASPIDSVLGELRAVSQGWTAPEVTLTTSRPVRVSTSQDLYAAGVFLYYLATGNSWWQQDGHLRTFAEVFDHTGSMPSGGEIAAVLPAAWPEAARVRLGGIIARALATTGTRSAKGDWLSIRGGGRYTDAAEMSRDLAGVLRLLPSGGTTPPANPSAPSAQSTTAAPRAEQDAPRRRLDMTPPMGPGEPSDGLPALSADAVPPGAVVNPYGAEGVPNNIMRGLADEDEAFGGAVTTALQRAQRVLVIGAGAGRIVWDVEQTASGAEVTSINKEGVIVFRQHRKSPAESFSNFTGIQARLRKGRAVSVEQARTFLPRFWRSVRRHDADTGLPSAPASVDVIIVPLGVVQYLKNKAELLAQIKRALKPGGMAFVNGLATLQVQGTSLEQFFVQLGLEYEYHEPGRLLIRNQHPQQPFPPLRLVTSTPQPNDIGLTTFVNVYGAPGTAPTLATPPPTAEPRAEQDAPKRHLDMTLAMGPGEPPDGLPEPGPPTGASATSGQRLEGLHQWLNQDSTHGVSAWMILEIAETFLTDGELALAGAYAVAAIKIATSIGHEDIPVDVVTKATWITKEVTQRSRPPAGPLTTSTLTSPATQAWTQRALQRLGLTRVAQSEDAVRWIAALAVAPWREFFDLFRGEAFLREHDGPRGLRGIGLLLIYVGMFIAAIFGFTDTDEAHLITRLASAVGMTAFANLGLHFVWNALTVWFGRELTRQSPQRSQWGIRVPEMEKSARPLVSFQLAGVKISQETFTGLGKNVHRHMGVFRRDRLSRRSYALEINGRVYYIGRNQYLRLTFSNGDEATLYDYHNLGYGLIAEYLVRHPNIARRLLVHYDEHADTLPQSMWEIRNIVLNAKLTKSQIAALNPFAQAQLRGINHFLHDVLINLVRKKDGWKAWWAFDRSGGGYESSPTCWYDSIFNRKMPLRDLKQSDRGGIGDFDVDIFARGEEGRVTTTKILSRYEAQEPRLIPQLASHELLMLFISDSRYISPAAALQVVARLLPKVAEEKRRMAERSRSRPLTTPTTRKWTEDTLRTSGFTRLAQSEGAVRWIAALAVAPFREFLQLFQGEAFLRQHQGPRGWRGVGLLLIYAAMFIAGIWGFFEPDAGAVLPHPKAVLINVALANIVTHFLYNLVAVWWGGELTEGEEPSVSGRMTRQAASRAYLAARQAQRYQDAVEIALEELRVADLWSSHRPTRQVLSTARLAELIDPPLVGALDLLSQQGIFTIDSSANQADVGRGFAYIEIDPVHFQHPHGLTADERRLLERLEAQGFFTREFPHRWALKFPVTDATTVRQLHDQAVAIVSQFGRPSTAGRNGDAAEHPAGATRAELGTVRCGIDELAVEEMRAGPIQRLEFYRTDRPRRPNSPPDLMIYSVHDQLRGVQIDPDLEGSGRLRFLVNQFLARYPRVRRTHPNVQNYVLLNLLMREYGFGAEGAAVTLLRREPVTPGDLRLQRAIFRVARPHQSTEEVICIRGMASGHPLGISLAVQDARALEQALAGPAIVQPAHRALEAPKPIAAQIADWAARGGAPRPIQSILLADDEPSVLEVSELALRHLGFQGRIVAVGSAEEALARLGAGERFDLILLDHLMRGMSGVEALPQLRAELPDAPVVLYSGMLLNLPVTAEQERYLQQDPRLFLLPKPAPLEDVKALLHALSTPVAEQAPGSPPAVEPTHARQAPSSAELRTQQDAPRRRLDMTPPMGPSAAVRRNLRLAPMPPGDEQGGVLSSDGGAESSSTNQSLSGPVPSEPGTVSPGSRTEPLYYDEQADNLNLTLLEGLVAEAARKAGEQLGFHVEALIVGGMRYLRTSLRSDLDVLLLDDAPSSVSDLTVRKVFVNNLDQVMHSYPESKVISSDDTGDVFLSTPRRDFRIHWQYGPSVRMSSVDPNWKEKRVIRRLLEYLGQRVEYRDRRGHDRQLAFYHFQRTLQYYVAAEYYFGDEAIWHRMRDRFLSIADDEEAAWQAFLNDPERLARERILLAQLSDVTQRPVIFNGIRRRLAEPLSNLPHPRLGSSTTLPETHVRITSDAAAPPASVGDRGLEQAFDRYYAEQGLTPYPALRKFLPRAIKEALLADPALRPVFLVPMAGRLGPLTVLDEKGLAAVGGPALLDRFSVFSVGSAEQAEAIAQGGVEIIVGVVDRPSTKTLFELGYEVVHGRQVYFPLPDGTWLGVKGVGQFRDPNQPPFWYDAQERVRPRYEGLCLEDEVEHARRSLSQLSTTDARFVRLLGYRSLNQVFDGTDFLPSSRAKSLDDPSREPLKPVLVFTRALSPHRLTKLPQVIEADPGLQRLRTRLSEAMGLPATMSMGEWQTMIVQEMGQQEGAKQRARLYKLSIHDADETLAAEETDWEEFVDFNEYRKFVGHGPTEDDTDASPFFEQTWLGLQGIAQKLLILRALFDAQRLQIHDETYRREMLALPEALQLFFEGYFQHLDDESLTVWADAQITQGSEAPVLPEAFVQLTRRVWLDVFHPAYHPGQASPDQQQTAEVAATIIGWARAFREKRAAAPPAERQGEGAGGPTGGMRSVADLVSDFQAGSDRRDTVVKELLAVKTELGDAVFSQRRQELADLLGIEGAAQLTAALAAASEPAIPTPAAPPAESTAPTTEEALQWKMEELSSQIMTMLGQGIGGIRLTPEEQRAARELLRQIAGLYAAMGLTLRDYHNHLHTVVITVTNLQLASAQGLLQSPRDLKLAFLAALLHDFHLRAVTAGRGKSASVAETLAQLSDILGLPLDGVGTPTEPTFFGMLGRGRTPEKDALRDAIWNLLGAEREATVFELVAMIRCTDFAQPTDPPTHHQAIEGAYQAALGRAAPDQDQRLRVDALARTLQTADYAGHYLRLPPELLERVVIPGLRREGVLAAPEDSYQFLKAVILQEAHLKRLAALPEADKRTLLAAVEYFARLGQQKHGAWDDWFTTTKPNVEQALGLVTASATQPASDAVRPSPPGEGALSGSTALTTRSVEGPSTVPPSSVSDTRHGTEESFRTRSGTTDAAAPPGGAGESVQPWKDRNYSEVMRFPELYRFLMDAAKAQAGDLAVVVLGPGFVNLSGETFSPQLVEVAAALGPARCHLTVVDGDPNVLKAVGATTYALSPGGDARSMLTSNIHFWMELKTALAALFNVQPEAVRFDAWYAVKLPHPVDAVRTDFLRWNPAPGTADILVAMASARYALEELTSQPERLAFLARLLRGLKPGGRLYLSTAEVAGLLMKSSPTELKLPEDLDTLRAVVAREAGMAVVFKRIEHIVELRRAEEVGSVPPDGASAVANQPSPRHQDEATGSGSAPETKRGVEPEAASRTAAGGEAASGLRPSLPERFRAGQPLTEMFSDAEGVNQRAAEAKSGAPGVVAASSAASGTGAGPGAAVQRNLRLSPGGPHEEGQGTPPGGPDEEWIERSLAAEPLLINGRAYTMRREHPDHSSPYEVINEAGALVGLVFFGMEGQGVRLSDIHNFGAQQSTTGFAKAVIRKFLALTSGHLTVPTIVNPKITSILDQIQADPHMQPRVAVRYSRSGQPFEPDTITQYSVSKRRRGGVAEWTLPFDVVTDEQGGTHIEWRSDPREDAPLPEVAQEVVLIDGKPYPIPAAHDLEVLYRESFDAAIAPLAGAGGGAVNPPDAASGSSWEAFIAGGIKTDPGWSTKTGYAVFSEHGMGRASDTESSLNVLRSWLTREGWAPPADAAGLVIGFGDNVQELIQVAAAFGLPVVHGTEWVNTPQQPRVEQAARYLALQGYSPAQFRLHHADGEDLSQEIPDASIGLLWQRNIYTPDDQSQVMGREIVRMLVEGGIAYLDGTGPHLLDLLRQHGKTETDGFRTLFKKGTVSTGRGEQTAVSASGGAGSLSAGLDPSSEGMAAASILPVFGLDVQSLSAATISVEQLSNGLAARRIRVPLGSPDALVFEGLELLPQELGWTEEFDVLVQEGRLIAVFPVPLDGGMFDERGLRFEFLDLSDYYFGMPSNGARPTQEQWLTFARQYQRDQAAIAAYQQRQTARVPEWSVTIRAGRKVLDHSYVLLDGQTSVRTFLPDAVLMDADLLRQLALPSRDTVVIPIFPTVFLAPFEARAMIPQVDTLLAGHDFDALVVGPGTGIVDVWRASRKTRRPIRVIGITPMEIANTRYLARAAGIAVDCVVGDNIITADGRLVFPGQWFDYVIWNMPAYETGSLVKRRLSDFHDGDDGSVLRRLAQGLPRLLRGRAILWNSEEWAESIIRMLEEGGALKVEEVVPLSPLSDVLYVVGRTSPAPPAGRTAAGSEAASGLRPSLPERFRAGQPLTEMFSDAEGVNQRAAEAKSRAPGVVAASSAASGTGAGPGAAVQRNLRLSPGGPHEEGQGTPSSAKVSITPAAIELQHVSLRQAAEILRPAIPRLTQHFLSEDLIMSLRYDARGNIQALAAGLRGQEQFSVSHVDLAKRVGIEDGYVELTLPLSPISRMPTNVIVTRDESHRRELTREEFLLTLRLVQQLYPSPVLQNLTIEVPEPRFAPVLTAQEYRKYRHGRTTHPAFLFSEIVALPSNASGAGPSAAVPLEISLAAARQDGWTDHKRYPIYTLGDQRRVVEKPTSTITRALSSRIAYVTGCRAGYPGINPVQWVARSGAIGSGISTVETHFGQRMESVLTTDREQQLFSRALELIRPDSGDASAYHALALRFGAPFVQADLYRLFLGAPDSSLLEQWRVQQSADGSFDIRWIDYDNALTWSLSERQIRAYVSARHADLEAYGRPLMERLAGLTNADLQAVAEEVYGEPLRAFVTRHDVAGVSGSDFTADKELLVRELQIRRDIFRSLVDTLLRTERGNRRLDAEGRPRQMP